MANLGARTTLSRNRLWMGWMLVAPLLVIRGFTTIYPTIETFRISLYRVQLMKGINEFVGLRNYVTVFSDPKIVTSIEFTVIFVVVSMVLHIVLGVALALILDMQFKGRRFLRTIVLLPWAMPMVVIGMAAKWAFNDTYGFINDLARRVVPGFHLDWLIHTESARTAVIAMDLWKDLPFFSILVLSALQFIPDELYDSSRIDGAGVIGSFFHITLPFLTRTILTLIIFFTMWRLTTFDIVYTLTTGGPGEDTALIAYRITMEAFTNLNLGYGATLAVMLFLAMMILSGINLLALRQAEK
jgi:multiple sugar transport system permease protein